MVKVFRSEEYARRLATHITTAIRNDPAKTALFIRLMRFAGSRGEDNPEIAAETLRDAALVYETRYPNRAAAATDFAEEIERQAKSVRRK